MAYGLKVWFGSEELPAEMSAPGDCWMVDVRIKVGFAGLTGDEVPEARVTGVIGGAGLRAILLTVVKDGLQAGVWGEGAVIDDCEATDVE